MTEERARILELLRKGKITVDEAEALLDALGPDGERVESSGGPPPPPHTGPRTICIRITDTSTGKVQTNVRIPIIAWGLLGKFTRTRLGRRLREFGLDLGSSDIRRAVHEHAKGHLVDVMDEHSGERVEVFFE
jgi:SHOCT-like domain